MTTSRFSNALLLLCVLSNLYFIYLQPSHFNKTPATNAMPVAMATTATVARQDLEQKVDYLVAKMQLLQQQLAPTQAQSADAATAETVANATSSGLSAAALNDIDALLNQSHLSAKDYALLQQRLIHMDRAQQDLVLSRLAQAINSGQLKPELGVL